MQKSPQDQSLGATIKRFLSNEWVYIGILGFLLLFPFIVQWVTGDSALGVGGRPRGQSVFWQSIFIEVFVLAILAMSYNLMFGFTGVISFGHALFFGIGGYGLGIILDRTGFVAGILTTLGLSPDGNVGLMLTLVLALAITLVIAGLVGFIMGLVSLRLKGVYFAIFTLALAEMAYIWTSRWAFTEAEDGFALRQIPEIINPTRNRLTYYYVALAVTVLIFLFIRRLINSPTGRVLLAIRENEDRAQSIGYNTLRYKLLSITLASMMAALAGVIHVVLNKKVGPELLTTTFTIEPLLMMIIGGIGTFSGPVLGAALLHLSERYLDREFIIYGMEINVGEYWALALGIAFIVVVLVFPQGIIGTVRGWWQNWRQSRRRQPAPSVDDPLQQSPPQ